MMVDTFFVSTIIISLQLQLQGESYDRKFILAHSFPMHKDNSLSRYVWNVYDRTWGNQNLLGEIENEMLK